MPAGAVIPIHHDTGTVFVCIEHLSRRWIWVSSYILLGYWVRRSHRVHVAIDTNDDVDFLVGPVDDKLEKVKLM